MRQQLRTEKLQLLIYRLLIAFYALTTARGHQGSMSLHSHGGFEQEKKKKEKKKKKNEQLPALCIDLGRGQIRSNSFRQLGL